MGKYLRLMKPRRPGIVKRLAYRFGARPSPGSLLYSPSLQWSYSMLGLGAAFAEGIRDEINRQSVIAAIYANPVHESAVLMFPLAVQRAAEIEDEHAREAVTRESHRDAGEA